MMRLLLAGMVILGAMMLQGCGGKFQPLEFRRIENLKVSQWNMIAPRVQADIVYYNPNAMGFHFKGGAVDVYLDSLWLGHSQIDTSIRINPHEEFTIVLPMVLDFPRLMKSGLTTYLNRQVHVRVDGVVTGSKAGIKKTFPVHYEGEQHLDLKLF
jgi:LEA14-like dessication related protein